MCRRCDDMGTIECRTCNGYGAIDDENKCDRCESGVVKCDRCGGFSNRYS